MKDYPFLPLFLLIFFGNAHAFAEIAPAETCVFRPSFATMPRQTVSTYANARCFGQRFPNFCRPRIMGRQATYGAREHVVGTSSNGNPLRCYMAYSREDWRFRRCLGQELSRGPFNRGFRQDELRAPNFEMPTCPRSEVGFSVQATRTFSRSVLDDILRPNPASLTLNVERHAHDHRYVADGTPNHWGATFMDRFSRGIQCVGRTYADTCRRQQRQRGGGGCYTDYKDELLEAFDYMTGTNASGSPENLGPSILNDISMRTGFRVTPDELQNWYREYRRTSVNDEAWDTGESAHSAHTSGLLYNLGMVNLLEPARIPGEGIVAVRGRTANATESFNSPGERYTVLGQPRYRCSPGSYDSLQNQLIRELQALRIPGATYVYSGGPEGHGHIEARGADGGYFSDFESSGFPDRCLVGIYIPQGQLEALCHQ